MTTTFQIDRGELARVFSPRAAKAFEEMQNAVETQGDRLSAGIAATNALGDATFVTLSANTELPNEYVLSVGAGLRIETEPGGVTLYNDGALVEGGHSLSFIVSGPTSLALPLVGIVSTRSGAETLENKTLDAPKMAGLTNAADDSAAAGAGVPVGGVYRNGSALNVRVS